MPGKDSDSDEVPFPSDWDPTQGEADDSSGKLVHRHEDLIEDARRQASPIRPGERVGERIGPYTLLEVLGEGGMGTVYLAEQKTPVQRRVALKIIKLGMDTRHVVARFESERQALALMNHPNIAQVYDAGATERGRPYFVMEHVKGVPITDYCDRHRLTTRERQELFIPVCQGIQHAHQKGVIHRDIKPSNVLVMVQDGKPVPKIIDFGVAKAVEHRLTEKTLYTEQGQLIGTPAYMSPEQAEMSALDIDTRTDIYSLGVLLYELLAGALPFDPRMLRRAAWDQIVRMIREFEPLKPSTRYSLLTSGHGAQATGLERSHGAEESDNRESEIDHRPHPLPHGRGSDDCHSSAAKIAQHRRSDPKTLIRELRGDLDWITIKAMDKDRIRRYATASELAADIERHLRNDPVLAGPPSRAYRLRKFVRKHRASVAAIAVFLLILSSALVVITGLYFQTAALMARADAANEVARAAVIAAEEARDEAWAQKQTAEVLRKEAEDRTEKLRRTAYRNQIALAQDAFYSKNLARLRELLVQCPADLRGWEWHRLDFISDPSLMTLRGEDGAFESIAFSPDGQRIVSAGRQENVVRIWSTIEGREILALRGHQGYVTSVAFSPDGARIASGSNDKTVRIWDAFSGGEIRTLGGHKHAVSQVMWNPAGTQISSIAVDCTPLTFQGEIPPPPGWKYDRESMLSAWNVLSGEQVFTVIDGDILAPIAYSADGRWIKLRMSRTTGGTNLGLYDAETGRRQNVPDFIFPEYDTCVFSPDGTRIAIGSIDGTLRLLDANSSKDIWKLQASDKPLVSIAFSPDGTLLVSGGSDTFLRVFDVEHGQEIAHVLGHQGAIRSVTFSLDGHRIASGSWDGTIKVWDIETCDGVLGFRAFEKGGVWSASLSTDGTRLLVSNFARELKLWDLVGMKGHLVLGASRGALTLTSALSPDGHWIARAEDEKTVSVWHTSTANKFLHFGKLSVGIANAIAFSPIGPRIVIGSEEGTVSLWDSQGGAELETFRAVTPDSDPVQAVAINSDGTLIAASYQSRMLRLWDVINRQEIAAARWEAGAGGSFGSWSISFSSDSTRVAASTDDTIRIWQVDTGVELFNLEGHADLVRSVAFSPDGTRLVSGSLDRTVKIWDTVLGEETLTLRGGEKSGADSDVNDGVMWVHFSPDGRKILSATMGGMVNIWQAGKP